MDDEGGETNMGRTAAAPAGQRPDAATHTTTSRLVFPKVETNRPFHVRSADRSLNVSLITEGTYPFHDGGVSVWCDQIVRGLAPDRFRIDAITAGLDDTACWMFPENVAEVHRIPLWGPVTRRRPALHLDPAIRPAMESFLASIATDDAEGAFRPSLEMLAVHAREGRLADALCSNEAVELTLRAMRSTTIARRYIDIGAVEAPTIADATSALTLLGHLLQPLTVAPPEVDLCHASSNGLSALVAMSAKWAYGTPFLLTEHGVYLRERYMEYRPGTMPQARRAFLLGFYKRLTLAAYEMADAIAPGSDYNRRWQQANGADVDKIEPIHNGIDLNEFASTPANVEHPTLVWIGRIDPLKDVKTLLRAFARVRLAIPNALLRIYGGTPLGNEGYLRDCLDLRNELGLDDSAAFEGRVRSISDAYLSGDVVVATSISEGFPYAVLEAMASGRAMIATDVGGVSEAIDDTGIMVPPQDEISLANACIELLRNAPLRTQLASRGRERVRSRFMVELSLERHAELYDNLVDAARESTGRS
jgi:glycosyltransferase involved in cell wall biosynthesis